jgi:hypothetical protein
MHYVSYVSVIIDLCDKKKLCGIAKFRNFTAESESEKFGSDPHH